ncbi:hypothetical protein C0389_06900 [bacterium]|nr:hypothetical protein [bacterium]
MKNRIIHPFLAGKINYIVGEIHELTAIQEENFKDYIQPVADNSDEIIKEIQSEQKQIEKPEVNKMISNSKTKSKKKL